MKIAILTPTYSYYSGIDRIVANQEEELGRKHNVTIYALKAEMKPKRAKLIVVGAPKSGFTERLYRLFFFLDFPKVRRYVKELEGYDWVISHFYPMNLLAYIGKKRYNYRYTFYNSGVACPKLFPSILERIYLRIFTQLNNLTARNADDAISISKFLKKILKKETGLDSRVEYVKIDTKRFNKKIDKKKIDEIREKYNLKKPTLLYVGRVSPHKGVHLLIKAFNIVKKSFPDAKLLIVGKITFSGYHKMLKRISGNSSDVIFTGFIPDEELPYYYGACDAYTTCSLWEGFDMPIAEANSCGKPAVAFDIGSHKEVLKNGVLVKKISPEEFAKAAIKVIK